MFTFRPAVTFRFRPLAEVNKSACGASFVMGVCFDQEVSDVVFTSIAGRVEPRAKLHTLCSSHQAGVRIDA